MIAGGHELPSSRGPLGAGRALGAGLLRSCTVRRFARASVHERAGARYPHTAQDLILGSCDLTKCLSQNFRSLLRLRKFKAVLGLALRRIRRNASKHHHLPDRKSRIFGRGHLEGVIVEKIHHPLPWISIVRKHDFDRHLVAVLGRDFPRP